jgi:hypothetical protein
MSGSPAVRDLATGDSVPYDKDGDRIVLRKLLPAQSAWVLEIRESGK